MNRNKAMMKKRRTEMYYNSLNTDYAADLEDEFEDQYYRGSTTSRERKKKLNPTSSFSSKVRRFLKNRL
jgi:hypothetical protein